MMISFAKTSFLRLDPFDFDGKAVSAQGDCSWEVIVLFFGENVLNIGQILRSPSRNLRFRSRSLAKISKEDKRSEV